MKNLVILFTAMIFGMSSSRAAEAGDGVAVANTLGYGNSFIFVEDGITFSVYPDGEFDFYIDNQVNIGLGINTRNVSLTFNSGFDYNPYVQYDDYGAVIQVENTPIYYDYYGRVSQIGNINVWYRNGRLFRLGGLYAYYGPSGVLDHCTGYIDVYNRAYVYRPFHRYFMRPAVNFCMVYNNPYRRHYAPVRYTYYRPYIHNSRNIYVNVGKTYVYNDNRRSTVYRNDNRVVVRQSPQRRSTYRSSSSNHGNGKYSASGTHRSNALANGNEVTRQGNTYRSTNRTSVNTERTVTRSTNYKSGSAPQTNRSVTRSTTVNTPKGNTANRTVTRQTTSSPSNSRATVSRSTTASSGGSKATRSSSYSRSSGTASKSTRSSGSSNASRRH